MQRRPRPQRGVWANTRVAPRVSGKGPPRPNGRGREGPSCHCRETRRASSAGSRCRSLLHLAPRPACHPISFVRSAALRPSFVHSCGSRLRSGATCHLARGYGPTRGWGYASKNHMALHLGEDKVGGGRQDWSGAERLHHTGLTIRPIPRPLLVPSADHPMFHDPRAALFSASAPCHHPACTLNPSRPASPDMAFSAAPPRQRAKGPPRRHRQRRRVGAGVKHAWPAPTRRVPPEAKRNRSGEPPSGRKFLPHGSGVTVGRPADREDQRIFSEPILRGPLPRAWTPMERHHG